MATEKHRGGCQCGAVAPVAAINVNCLEGVDPRALSPTHVDGRSF